MAKGKEGHGGEMLGPVLSPMTEDFEMKFSDDATDGGVYSGVPGYPKANDGVIKEIMFDVDGAFGEIKQSKD